MPSFRDCIVLLEAAALAVHVVVGLRIQTPKTLICRLGQAARRGGPALVPILDPYRAARLVEAISAPCRMRCLTQSLVLFRILRRRGLAAELRIGVRRVGDNLNAHAWVEYDGHVLLDGEIADEFTTLPLKA